MTKVGSFHNRVFAAVRRIPSGRVATYGQIAGLIGSPRAAQQVGWALHLLEKRPDPTVPWQRVINRHGMLSIVNLRYAADEQANLLQAEGVVVSKKDDVWFVDLEKYLWEPKENPRSVERG
ncbi:MAG: MGMT family protein [Patescibacteria group bacterium]|jgi:methylated-DNA-protein-cysteine methyltransferase-like protein